MSYQTIHFHPSIFSFNSLETYPQEVEALCECLFERRFSDLELSVLSLVETVLERNTDSDYSLIHGLIHDFNTMYIQWLYDRKFSVRKELDDINSLEHDNYLLAYCQGVTEMEAILETAELYLMDQNSQKHHVIAEMISTYRRWFSS